MLHTAPGWRSWKMIDEHVAVEGTIIHPVARSRRDFVQHGSNCCHVVVARLGIDNYAIVSASFVEIRFLEVSDLNRRIDQAVVAVRAEFALRQCGSGVATCHVSGIPLKRT